MASPWLRTAAIAALGGLVAVLLAGCVGREARRSVPYPEGTLAASGTAGVEVHAGDVLAGCRAANVVAGSQVEPFLAVSPLDPSLVAAVWQQDRFTSGAALGIVVAVSRDAARTWSVRQLPDVTGCGGGAYRAVSDPQVGIGPDGRIYVSVIAVGAMSEAVLVSSSGDCGRSWSEPSVVRRVANGSIVLDRPALLADRYRAGTAYEVWVEYPRAAGESLSALRVDTAFVARSHDGGRTWTNPTRVFGSNTENQSHVPLELADGSLIDVFADAYRLGLPSSPEQVVAVRSTDRGGSWSAPIRVARFPFSVATADHGHPVRASGQDLSAYAQGKSVYVTWESNRPGRSEIGVAYSTDGGKRWIRTPDPVDGRDEAFLPEITADFRGDVAVTWYQTRRTKGDPTTVYFRELARGAPGWDITAGISLFSLDDATPSQQGYFLGDYEGLAPGGCGFRALDSIATIAGTRIITVAICG